LLIVLQATREYQQGEGFNDVAMQIGAKICDLTKASKRYEKRRKMLTTFLALLLKLISSPALLAGLIAFLQKSLNP
jgi:hypothetical protein